jgi:hypothetical protein
MNLDTGPICIQDTVFQYLGYRVDCCAHACATDFVLYQTHVAQHHTHITQHHTHKHFTQGRLWIVCNEPRSQHGLLHCKHCTLLSCNTYFIDHAKTFLFMEYFIKAFSSCNAPSLPPSSCNVLCSTHSITPAIHCNCHLQSPSLHALAHDCNSILEMKGNIMIIRFANNWHNKLLL